MKKRVFLFPILFLLAYTAMAQSGTNTITVGTKLTEGQRLVSANKNYYLAMQADGNLCIYTSTNTFVWCSMLYLGTGSYLTMQADGNLVVYNGKSQPAWNSMTQAFYDSKYATAEWKPVRAVLEDNGSLCLYTVANKKVWSSADKQEPTIVSPGVGFTGPSVKKDLKVKIPGSASAGNYTVEINNRGEVFYNGDMNLGPLEKLNQKAEAPSGPDNSFKWPNSTVPYVLPASHARREIIQKGIEFLNAHTTICMVPRTSQTDYVEFISRDGNWSRLGREGGRQEISIENNNIGTVVHEVMHALGFHHTQCREDRDKYVTIDFGNVQKGMEHNFQKRTDKESNLGVYDYTSCMHYASYGFAVRKGTKTIIRKDGKTEEMGTWEGMSVTDVSNIALVYPPCGGKAVKPLPTTEPTAPTTTTSTAACEARDAVKKYQTSMNLGKRLLEKEKMLSANNRFQLRGTTDGNFVIEEILTSGNCPYKEVYRFPLSNGGSKPGVSFLSYNPDGNVCMDNKFGKAYCATSGQDAKAASILGKSVKLELTDDGRLRLVNSAGQEIWATSPAGRVAPTTTTTTTPGRTAPPTTQPTTTARTAPAKKPVVDQTPAVAIPKYTPKEGEFENVVLNETSLSIRANANWIGTGYEDPYGAAQAIDGNRAINMSSEEPRTCKSTEAHTPGWEVDLGRKVYVEYIQIWNSDKASTLKDRKFYVTFATSYLAKRMGNVDPATNLPYLDSRDRGSNGGNSFNEPLGPYKWETGQKSMIIPIKKEVKMLNIKLAKDGENVTPITLEEVEVYGKELTGPRRS